jgi:hypothetical protein
LGRDAEAIRLVRAAEEQLAEGTPSDARYLLEVWAQDLASYYGFVGDLDGAVRWIRFAFQRSPAGVDARILGSALFDPVRGQAGFAATVQDIQDAARRGVGQAMERIEPPL